MTPPQSPGCSGVEERLVLHRSRADEEVKDGSFRGMVGPVERPAGLR